MGSADTAPVISVLVLNYNGAQWLPRCLESLRRQTIFGQIEIVITDNQSPDDSARLAADLTRDWPNARVIQNGANLGFAEGNNRAAKVATGEYLFLLNNDTWLESDCLEKLVQGIEANDASAGCPLVLNYDDNSFQSLGAFGFDIFGLPTERGNSSQPRAVLMPEGCAYLIKREVYEKLVGLDPEFFMFSEEYDLSWRLWIAGCNAICVPSAVLHHRGAAQVNPAGGGSTVEFRTSDTKRFYANRNALLSVLKNANNLLLVMFFLQLGLLAAEALVALVLIRRWIFIRRAYIDAVAGCWSLRSQIRTARHQIRAHRKRGDLWMLRFLRLRPNRWDELLRIRQRGVPRVSQS
jgi:GT2 family glycosyltransferase